MPKVSVIVPVYNTKKYLGKCLDSLINQTLDDIEIVAIDDGSTDGSSEMLDVYAERFSTKLLVRHKRNGGQATARNLALRLCSGEYIGFLDSDDYVEKDMFEKLFNKAIQCGADYVGCAYKDLFDDGQKETVLQEYVGNKPCDNNRTMFLNGVKVSPFINFYKRELIIDNGIFFTEGYIYEDTAFWAKIVPYIKKPVFIEEALACRVRHDNSTTTITKPEKIRNIFPVIEDIINFYNEKDLYSSFYYEIEYFCSRVLLCSSIERISRVQSRADRRLLLNETFSFIKKNFSDYKKNKYLSKNKVDIYIRFSNRLVCNLMIGVLKIVK